MLALLSRFLDGLGFKSHWLTIYLSGLYLLSSTRSMPRAVVINQFYCSITTIWSNKALWLVTRSHVNLTIQSECFILTLNLIITSVRAVNFGWKFTNYVVKFNLMKNKDFPKVLKNDYTRSIMTLSRYRYTHLRKRSVMEQSHCTSTVLVYLKLFLRFKILIWYSKYFSWLL